MEQLNYIMFENDKNNCWLDAAVVLIANNKTFKDIIENASDSQIKNIITTYNNALTILNDNNINILPRLERTRKMLRGIQADTLHYLRKFLKFKPGEPESAFCALLNLIIHDTSKIKEELNVSWIWQKSCDHCGCNSKSNLVTKPIITLPKVNYFYPVCPTSVYMCSCKKEQEMKLIYKELPNCLIFHFEKGVGNGNNVPINFIIENKRVYHLTSVVILEKSSDPSVNHFVTWIREPFKDMWLDCNDLNTNVTKFVKIKPELDLKDLYMCLYEAFDEGGKICLETSADAEMTDNIKAELIYLSDEGDDPKNVKMDICMHDQDIKDEELSLSIENYLANNLRSKYFIDHKEEFNLPLTAGTFKLSDSREVNNLEKSDVVKNKQISEFLNIDKPDEWFRICVDHEIEDPENIKEQTINQNVSEVNIEAEILHAGGEIPNILDQKNKDFSEKNLMSEKDILGKCKDNDEMSPHKMQVIVYKEALVELGKTQKENPKSDCSQNDENSQIVKQKTAVDKMEEGSLAKDTEKTNKECNVHGFDLKNKLSFKRDRNKMSNLKMKALDEKSQTRRKKQTAKIINMNNKAIEAEDDEERKVCKKQKAEILNSTTSETENNASGGTKSNKQKPILDKAMAEELEKIVNKNVKEVFAKFMAEVCRMQSVDSNS